GIMVDGGGSFGEGAAAGATQIAQDQPLRHGQVRVAQHLGGAMLGGAPQAADRYQNLGQCHRIQRLRVAAHRITFWTRLTAIASTDSTASARKWSRFASSAD